MRKIQNIIVISFIAFVGLLMFAECKVNEADIKGGLPYVKLALADTALAKTDQVVDIPVETNRPLTVEVNSVQSGWISGVVTDNILRLTVKANDLEIERVATLTISTTNKIATATLSVRQDPSGQLTIDGDLILRSKAIVAENTYTKTTKNLILGDVTEITTASNVSSAAASDDAEFTEFGTIRIKATPSDIDNSSIELLTKQITEVRGKTLVVLNTAVSDLPLELISANSIDKVYFDYNNLTELPASDQLASLGLAELSLKGNALTDISNLSGCTTLKHLNLSHTGVYDLSSILSLTDLETLSVAGAPISVTHYEIFREKFPKVIVDTTDIQSDRSPLPELTVTSVEEVSETSFKITAKVDQKGGSQPSRVGFYVGKGRVMSDMQFVEATLNSDGTFSVVYDGDILSDNIYFFRAYAVNNIGEGYSRVEYFGSITVKEDVYLKTKSEMQEFFDNNISHIEGSLFIGKAEGTHSSHAIKLALADTVLYFGQSDIDNLDHLMNLVSVSGGIYIGNTSVTDISHFANLEHAETIWAKGNKLTTVPDFSKVEGLNSVDVSRNVISDIKPVFTSNIASLYLGDSENPSSETNNIGILNGLEGMTSLRYLDLSGLPIHKWQVDSLKAKMTGCEIIFTQGGREPMLPTVSNRSIEYTESGSIILMGYLDKRGASDVVEHGFYYGKDIKSLTKVKVGDNIDASIGFEAEVSVPDSAKYYYQAYAINSLGESHSETIGEFSLSAIDLSAAGLANCYIVSNAGRYTFNPHIIGNGKDGIIKGAGFHTENVEISPVSAKLLWEEKEGMITEVSYRSGLKDVIFTTSGVEGNAVIAVCDAEGTILWSWHIWCTDRPIEQKYVNSVGTFYVLDRNIGAIRADRGTEDQWIESVGMLYQWGRKDPFVMDSSFDKAADIKSVVYYINNPNIYAYSSEWDYNFTNKFWDSDRKTIYDPCPLGYRVQTYDAVSDLVKKGSFDKGLNVLYDNVNNAWYPATPNYDCFGQYRYTNSYGYVWISDNAYIISIDNSGFTAGSNPGRAKGDGYPVRCMKEKKIKNPNGSGEGYTGDEYEW